MAEISAAIITRDEERELFERCLESIRDFADEIIIADSSSRNTAEDVAGNLARIYPVKWTNDFSSARNFSISKATKDIIFVIDSDEALSEVEIELFHSFKKLDPTRAWGISLPARNYFKNDIMDIRFRTVEGEYPEMEKGSSGYVVSEKVRLFPKNPKFFFEGRIHETVESSILKSRGEIVKRSSPVIHHFGYLKERSLSQKKQKAYEKLLRKELEEKPKSFKALYDYAHHLYLQDRVEEAFQYFERAYSVQKLKDVAFFLGILSLKMKDPEQALVFFNSIKDPENPVLLFYRSQALRDSGQDGKALPLLRKALRLSPKNLHILHALGNLYLEKGMSHQAKSLFEKIKKQTQDSRPKTQD